MQIFSRYVFRQAAGSFLLILVSLTGVVWIALALRQFNVVTSEGQDTWMLIKMTSLALPNLMAIIAPFSFLIAALHTLNRLNTDSELIVLSASGSKVWTVARPLLLLAFLVSLFLAFVSHLAQPWSMRLLRGYMVQVRTDLLTQVIQPGRFSSPETNLMFHIRERRTERRGACRGNVSPCRCCHHHARLAVALRARSRHRPRRAGARVATTGPAAAQGFHWPARRPGRKRARRGDHERAARGLRRGPAGRLDRPAHHRAASRGGPGGAGLRRGGTPGAVARGRLSTCCGTGRSRSPTSPRFACAWAGWSQPSCSASGSRATPGTTR